MAIPVHIPYDEGLIGQVARPDHGLWIGLAQSPFELGCIRHAIVHPALDLAHEGEIVGRVQKERGPRPAWPQRFHRADRAGGDDRIAAGGIRFDLAGASQIIRSA
jgi:hypothetical protein